MSEFSALAGTEGYGVCPDEVKLQRAQGECLGIRSRRRSGQAAISLGERHIRIDPGITEWGNPAEQYSVILR